MRTLSEISHLIVCLVFVTAFPDLQALKLETKPDVTGYLGQEVTLKCELVQRPKNLSISQVQWDLMSMDQNLSIIVFNSQYGLNIKASPLKGRVNLTDQSLKISDLKMTDAGSYTCQVTTFPNGPIKGITKLVVVAGEPERQMQTHMSAGILSAIIVSAVLLLVILTAASYLTYVKRHNAAHRLQVHIDTSRRAASVTRPSYIFRDSMKSQEVIYADVRPKLQRNSGSSLNKIPKTAASTEEVTYAEVKVYRQSSDSETVFIV